MSRTLAVFFPMMPTVSNELAYATTPHREINPYDGLKPTVPVYAAGSLTEPPVSVPNELYRSATAIGPTDPDSRIALISSYRSCTSAGATTGRKEIPRRVSSRVLHRAKMGVDRVRAHAKLIQIRLSGDNGPGTL